MQMNFAKAALKVSELLPPEMAKDLALFLLRQGIFRASRPNEYHNLQTRLGDFNLSNPVGIPAGLDKSGNNINALFGLGCSFIEVGTVTPNPQIGNPKPRLFRIKDHEELINRLGLNNLGSKEMAQRLRRANNGNRIIGVSAGHNSDSIDIISDYQAVVRACGRYANFITLNISCPNIHQGINLNQPENLQRLITRVFETIRKMDVDKPVYLKLSADYDDNRIEDIVTASLEAGINGLIATNSTLSRPYDGVRQYSERGGLTGPSLFPLSTKVLAHAYSITQGRIPLIGVGGISSPEDAYDKITAGANAIQLYTALTYKGPELIPAICLGLSQRLQQEGLSSINDAVGTQYSRWLD